MVTEFGEGEGEKLHKLLVERAKGAKTHWLQGKLIFLWIFVIFFFFIFKKAWWDSWAYFAVRDPIPINVNYFFHYEGFKPHTATQTRRAAELIVSALHFKDGLEK